jgi:hypothetical protein
LFPDGLPPYPEWWPEITAAGHAKGDENAKSAARRV